MQRSLMHRNKVIEVLLCVENFSSNTAMLKPILSTKIPGRSPADTDPPAKFRLSESKFCHFHGPPGSNDSQQLLLTVK